MASLPTVLCPFCFTRSPIGNLLKRSVSGPLELDQQIAEAFGIPAPELPRLQRPDAPASTPSTTICPHCHINLPHALATGQLAGDIIAVVGVRGSGKSNFFAVLLKELERRYNREVGMTLHDLLTFSVKEGRSVGSRQVYRERYGSRLYNEAHAPTAIDPNRTARQDVDLRFPLLYRLNITRPWFLPPFRKMHAVDLIVYDAAGEDLADPINLQLFCSFLLAAKGIVFLLDAGQIPAVRDQMPESMRRGLPPVEVEPADIISRVIDLFEAGNRVRVNQKIPVPVAIALSKSDLLARVDGAVEPDSPIFADSHHQGGYNVADGRRVSDEVQKLLRQWGSDSITDLVRDRFKRSSYFALSALGDSPDEQLQLRRVRPRRVADPLLWLMHQMGHLPAARTGAPAEYVGYGNGQ